jgi:hypothetical protein
MTTATPMIYLGVTRAEAEALLEGTHYLVGSPGPPPDPPTPAMTAQRKLEKALG